MSAMTLASRRRPKPQFVTELPVRVLPVDHADRSFDRPVEKLSLVDSGSKELARQDLLLIARDYRLSRDLNLVRVSRSDTAETLRAIGRSAQGVVDGLSQLDFDERAALESMISGVSELDWTFGIQAIDTLGYLLDGVADAATDLARITIEARLDGLNPGLGLLAAATRLAASQLGCFPDAAKWSLVVIQQYAPLSPNLNLVSSNVALLSEACENLRRLSEALALVSTGERGPRSSTAQMVAVQRLRAVYEQYTGNPATHSSKIGLRYTGALEGDFGQFVEAAFNVMESDRRLKRGLAEAVSYAIWPCRASDVESKVKLARANLERRTREALALVSVTNNSSAEQ